MTDEAEAAEIKKCQDESKKTCWHYQPGVFRERFVSPWEQYRERVGQKFTVIKQTHKLVIDSEDQEGEEDVYLIRFEDGVEIEAWGSEVGVEDKEQACGKPCHAW